MRVVISILLFTAVAVGQQRSTKLDTMFPAPGASGTVTLTLSEYDRLVELANRKGKTASEAPLPFVLSRAVFNLRVVDQTLLGTVDIEGALLGQGSVKTPLTTGLTILEAKQSGNPLPLLREGASHAAILNGPGPFAVSLGVATPLVIDAGRASVILPVPLASSSILSLELPGSHANVSIEPGLVTSRETTNGTTKIEAALEPGKAARISWTTREIAAPVAQREVRFLSNLKSVISVGDSQLRLTVLCDLNVIQGETTEFKFDLPDGFELVTASGNTLESSVVSGKIVTLRVHDASKRKHQFLIEIERSQRDAKVDAPFLTFSGAQREIGELLVEGVGAMDLEAKESGGLRRMDVREASAITRSLSRFPVQAAFRYNLRSNEMPKLHLEWRQFQDAEVLSAVAERATITTLTNVEGRTLTEVSLRVRNHAKLYLKVELPAGAQLLSAEVENEPVKPVEGPDGRRVPLVRPGLNASRPYTVSFVYLNSGTRFGKKGSYNMELPKVDIPINVLTWEVSLPDRLQVKKFGGNALAADLLPTAVAYSLLVEGDEDDDYSTMNLPQNDLSTLKPGQIGGIVVDTNGAVIPGAVIVVINTQTGMRSTTTSNGTGHWAIMGMQPGAVRVNISRPGFRAQQQDLELVSTEPARIGTTLDVGAITETVTVVDGASSNAEARRIEDMANKEQLTMLNSASQNVFNLQRRVAGLLPVAIEVPRSGRSYRFVRPLVLEEETTITFEYKSK